MNWYFTFGSNHLDKNGNSLGDKYVIIRGTWGEAREKMVNIRGAKWAFQYNETDFIPQIKKYGLHRISLETVTILKKGEKPSDLY